MRKNGKRLVLSVGAVLTALCITAGVTMAWFHDTEPLAANFSAGKLDITVTPDQAEPGEQKIDFENLRPMTEKAFAEELAEADGNIVNANTEGYSPVPVYFHPVTVRNEGTLPAQVLFQMVDDGPDGKVDVDEITVENVTVNGQVYGEKVTQTGEQVTCDASNYILKDKLKIFVYQKNAGYLPEDAGNAYQAKHYHGVLLVYAGQVDEDAEWGPAEPEKLAAPTVYGEPEKAFYSDYYTISFQEDFDTVDAWKAAVQRVTVNGVEYSKTDNITFDSNQTYQLPLADNEIRIGSGSFQSGTTYHVVVEAEGYENVTCDIVAE